MLMAMLNAKSAEDQVTAALLTANFETKTAHFSEDCVCRVPPSLYARILSNILETDARASVSFNTNPNRIIAAK
jgi:hypothetical protein